MSILAIRESLIENSSSYHQGLTPFLEFEDRHGKLTADPQFAPYRAEWDAYRKHLVELEGDGPLPLVSFNLHTARLLHCRPSDNVCGDFTATSEALPRGVGRTGRDSCCREGCRDDSDDNDFVFPASVGHDIFFWSFQSFLDVSRPQWRPYIGCNSVTRAF